MPHPQSGIFALGTSAHCYLEFDLLPTIKAYSLVEAVSNLEQLQSTVGGLNTVVGFRPSLWESISPENAPSAISDFDQAITGPDGFSMPATQHDLWIWIAGPALDVTFDGARHVIERLRFAAQIKEDVMGWSYRHNRDLTGFIDGSANPNLLEAPDFALIPPGNPGQSGSVLLIQKWRHNLVEFDKVSINEQEKIIGRTKETSGEFDDDQLPATSHVARTTLKAGDNELPIFRRNTSYGTPTNHGTMFVGFSKDQNRLNEMLNRMAGIPDGVRDALTNYTVPVTGSYYFVPSIEALRHFATEIEFLSPS